MHNNKINACSDLITWWKTHCIHFHRESFQIWNLISSAFSWMKMFEFWLKISLIFFKVPINNIPTLVQKIACRRPGDKPLSEPMMISLPTHICVTRPQSINQYTLPRDRNGCKSSRWCLCEEVFPCFFFSFQCVISCACVPLCHCMKSISV